MIHAKISYRNCGKAALPWSMTAKAKEKAVPVDKFKDVCLNCPKEGCKRGRCELTAGVKKKAMEVQGHENTVFF